MFHYAVSTCVLLPSHINRNQIAVKMQRKVFVDNNLKHLFAKIASPLNLEL